MDEAPKFDPNLDFYKTQLDKKLSFNIWKDGGWGTYRHLHPNLDFYKTQLDKKLSFNIWKDGGWGTYRHLPLSEAPQIECEDAYINVSTKGDFSSLAWLEGNANTGDRLSPGTDIIHVYYASLNFKDLMIASGKIAIEVFIKDRIQQERILGMEFAGRNSKGERVFGMCPASALSTLVRSKFHLAVPDDWTMEDAATVITVYGTVYQSLLKDTKLTPGQSILIHSGTGGVGQAAINLALHYGLTIFVTVGTQEKRDFIRKTYPQIREEHIGNSRDTSFEDMVYKYTEGRGVDFVLNSLAEEKLIASVRCLAKGGKFLEMGKFDLASNNLLALQLLEKDAQFRGLALDQYLTDNDDVILNGYLALADLIKLNGYLALADLIKQAFRYLGSGSHIGKVLIKVRDEEDQKICAIPKTLFKAAPRFYCKPECSYVICGGLGGFGVELADLLVTRGAKKLVLTSRSGTCNGYHRFRLKIWQNYDVTVRTSSCDASTEEGEEEEGRVPGAGDTMGRYRRCGIGS
ncbi:KR domain [Popillia japonica]|uniref:KR domain n=1 Tax=Popillia japonica TaxID=7064 RepID=A0AAW1MIF2_POPJA